MIKLEDIFTGYRTNLITNIVDKYNSINTTVVINETLAGHIITLMEMKLGNLLNCDTVYTNVESGYVAINKYISFNVLNLVNEIKQYLEALNKNMGQLHRQSKFNNIDNTDIDNAPINIDNTEFTYADVFSINIDFLLNNCKVLNRVCNIIAKDCYLIRS